MGGLLRSPLALLPSPGQRRHRLSAVHRLFHGRVLGDVLGQGCAYRESPHQPARATEADPESAGWQRVHGNKQLYTVNAHRHGDGVLTSCLRRSNIEEDESESFLGAASVFCEPLLC